MNKGMAGLLGALAFPAALTGVGVAEPVTLDPAAVAFKLPDQIYPSGNRTAVLQGDPAKPGPYAMPGAMAAGQHEPPALSSQ